MKKAKKPKEPNNLFTPPPEPAPVQVLAPPPEFPPIPDLPPPDAKGVPDPALDKQYCGATNHPKGDWRNNILPRNLPVLFGANWTNKYMIGIPRRTRMYDEKTLLSKGFVGVYMRPFTF
jgi:hypothetical protein